MNKDQKGLALLESLLILVIVALIGFIGWYVWNSNKKTNVSLNNANKSSNVAPQIKAAKKSSGSNTSATTSEPMANWKEYKSKFGFSFKYPSDYHVDTQIEKNTTLAQAVQSGTNSIDVTSFTANPDGPAKDLHCASSGSSIPNCDVKVEFSVDASGKATSAIFPEDTALKDTAQKIIGSYKTP
jgi:type II secretory pathway pseudopilin PulG